jgi:hypothetical protein
LSHYKILFGKNHIFYIINIEIDKNYVPCKLNIRR